MNLSPELIVAISALLTGIGALWRQALSDKRAARKDALESANTQIDLLTTRIERAEKELENERRANEELRKSILDLTRENAWLKTVLSSRGIAIPPIPEGWAR